MISVVNLGSANIGSVLNMLRRVQVPARVAESVKDIDTADKIILPGVGHFADSAARLAASPFREALETAAMVQGKPVLGICLGMQLMTRGSEEGQGEGLGWVPANTVRFQADRVDEKLLVPHMGWNDVTSVADAELTRDLPADTRFYFCHSYHVECDEPSHVLLRTTHGYEFTSAFMVDNLIGVQFHPEKSLRFGMALLERFAGIS